MSAFEIIVIILLADIALSVRRRLIGGTTWGTTWFPLYPLDWPYLITRWWTSRDR